MQRTRLAVLAAIGAATLPLSLGSTAAFAQAFPTKAIKVVVPQPPPLEAVFMAVAVASAVPQAV